jgi:two-component system sensor histidine kinase/response regulator
MSAEAAKILIIEDEKQVRQSYIEMFTFFGYEVDAAIDGEEGIRLVNQNEYDIVVTDLNMPHVNGMEVLKYVKKKKPHVEVIVITGYATLENAIIAMKIGAYDYFTKPIDLEHVRIVLSKCIHKIKARRENEKLRSVNAKLKELNELKSKFITITNHEMRTPITVLKGYLELLDGLMDHSNEELNEAMEICMETTRELVNIVDQMHDLSSIDSGKFKMHYSTFSLEDMLFIIFKEMRLLFDQRGIQLKLNINAPDILINCDYHRIKRSIREVVQNALKFTDEGGEVTINCTVSEIKKNVKISIADTGIGIPVDKQELVFEPFYEVQSTIHHTTSKTDFMGGGIGLGLSLARDVVESHNGQIFLESEENKGSTVTIVLPFVRVIKQEERQAISA